MPARSDPSQHTGVLLVEFHSGGQVAERAREARDLGYRVIVVDNSGTYDGPGDVLVGGENVGFGSACNAGSRRLPSDVDVLVLMNPDARVDPGGLAAMVDEVRSGTCDALAPMTMNAAGTRMGFTLPSSARELFLTARECQRSLTSRRGAVGADLAVPVHRGGAAVTRAPTERFGSGALLVLRRAAFESVGGFDENFFLYVEDADLWDRLRRHGCRMGFATAVTVVHQSGHGSRASGARRMVLRRLGIEYYLASRGRSYRAVRVAHRLLMPRSAGAADGVLSAVRGGYRDRASPSEIQERVKSYARRDLG